MSELKRTVLYQAHLDAGATMVDFGGWVMKPSEPDGSIIRSQKRAGNYTGRRGRNGIQACAF